MKYVKIFILLITFIIFVNPIFACAISGIVNGITCNSCDNITKICECNVNTTPLESSTSKLFNLSGCEDYTINLNLNAKTIWFKENLNMNDTNWNLVISGSSNIVIDNSKSLDINLSNIIIESNADAKIKNLSESFSSSSIKINFITKDITVKPNSKLEIKIKTNDGKNGTDGDSEGDDGTDGISSGDLIISFKNFINFGNSIVELGTGNGGKGGQPHSEDTTDERNGRPGGSSGNLNLRIQNIENNNNLNIILKTGNGGNGSHSPKDDSADDSFNGGNGGHAGNININEIKLIKNQGDFSMQAIAGNGGWAGTSRFAGDNDCDFGNDGEQDNHGDSGNGGDVSDLNITTLINRSPNFKLNLKSGELGKRNVADGTCTNHELDKPFGFPGTLGNIDINFLENTYPGIEIISQLNFSLADYQLAATAQANNNTDDGGESGDTGYMRKLLDLGITVTNVNINNLKNGSYLPKSINIKSEPEHPIFNNSIDLSGCYIQPSQVTYNLNGGTNIYATNIESINSFLPAGTSVNYRYCPHCEVIDLTDEVNRYTREYNIYSNVNGKILPGDLKIFYFNPVTNQIYYTKRIDNTLQPIYTNKEEISSEMNDKIGMREFKLEKNKLVWFGSSQDEDRNDLAEDEYLFCYGQEYILKGKITIGNNSKEFEFPFVPLRELFNN